MRIGDVYYMNIVYASDNNFVSILGISMISLFENNTDENITVYILSDGIEDKNKDILRELGHKYHQKVEIFEVNVDDYTTIKLDILTWSRAAFSRMFIGTILEQFDLKRVIYLDCDIAINGNIRGLWDLNLKNHVLGMAIDPVGKGHKKNVGISQNKPYYNSGVLVIDMDLWKKKECEKRLQEFAIKNNGKTPYVDQGLINGALKNYIIPIPLRYNLLTVYCDYSYEELLIYRKPTGVFYSKNEIESAKKSPIIIHYTKSIFTERPWIKGSTHKKKNIWEKYKNLSPWKDEENKPVTLRGIKKHYVNISNRLPRRVNVHIQGFLHSIIKPIIDAK